MPEVLNNRKRRFVVLLHEFPEGHSREDHWDLMLEEDEKLLTWALTQTPQPGRRIPAVRLADHRSVYLSYEGLVSENRGRVTRVMSGVYEWKKPSESQVATLSFGTDEIERQIRWEVEFDSSRAGQNDSLTVLFRVV